MSKLTELRQRIAELEASEAESKEAEERVEHLNLVLRAIRNVNQLITREKDRDQLLKGICKSLIETRGYYGTWIVLLDDSRNFLASAQARFGKRFISFIKLLKQGDLPVCVKKALKKSGVVVIKDPPSMCGNCPLVAKYAGRSSIAIRLEYEGKIYGVLGVSCPPDHAKDEEERSLFTEVADDIAFALHNIEVEDERKKAEEEATRQMALLDDIIDLNPYSVQICDKEGHYVRGNRAFVELFKEAPPPEYSIFDDPNLKKAGVQELVRKVKGREPVRIPDIWYNPHDIKPEYPDKLVCIHTAIFPLCAPNGEIEKVVLMHDDITERRKAEKELHLYEHIVSSSSDMLAILDKNFAYLSANEAYVEAFEKTHDDIIGHTVSEVFGEEFFDTVIKLNAERCMAGEEVNYQAWFDFPAYEQRYMDIHYYTYLGMDNEVKGFIVNGRNITELKKAEEESERLLMQVEQERDKLQVLIDSITDEVWFADTKGRFTIANPSALREFGIDTDDEVEVEELAKSLEVLHPDGSPRPVEEAPPLRALSGELVRCQEEIVRTPASGELRYRQVSSAPVRDSTGSIIGAVSVVRDITEHKQAEKRLEKVSTATESVLNDILLGEEDEAETERRILDACLAATDSPYGMVGKINEEGNFDTTTYAGEAMEDCAFPEALAWDLSTGMPIQGIWGWPMLHGEALICNDLETHPDKVGCPEGHAPIKCFLGAPLKRDGKVVGMVAVANRPGGYSEEDKYALIKLTSAISVSRRHREALDEVTRTSTDLERLVIELKEAQEQLIRREKLAVLGQLAGGVGHELRNPLGAIKNAAYFLNMAIEEPEPEVKETLEILEREVTTSERIISSLLDFARPKPPALRKVDVNDVIQVALSRATVPENIELVSELDVALPTILADPDQLGPVFDNFILNALQAMPEGGRLTVTSEAPDPEWVTVSVTDTGVGIPEENLEKLFQALFTTKAKGIGFGLPVTKALVDGHGGTIEVKSIEGEGSTFTVRLPVSRGEEK